MSFAFVHLSQSQSLEAQKTRNHLDQTSWSILLPCKSPFFLIKHDLCFYHILIITSVAICVCVLLYVCNWTGTQVAQPQPSITITIIIIPHKIKITIFMHLYNNMAAVFCCHAYATALFQISTFWCMHRLKAT